ncbi:hypothetical protein M9H77_28608 [Catharanthus roseus]|uniref:Uncharacterized protein n=1 Tax=Catharanthus roseus TaxID=4058 RepID=A0ACC0AG37_CATRO|nr:hypothetical protein M9H77_28608 [Catharanthus roseus]
MVRRNAVVLGILAFGFFVLLRSIESVVPPEEVAALQRIVTTLGATYWKFNADSCSIEMVGLAPQPPNGAVSDVRCDCSIANTTGCHVTKISLKGYNLPGVLPSELVNLPYIQEIDLAYNYLHGTIPSEWSSTKLNFISVFANRLSGEIPKELGNITSLRYLNLEANQFSGFVPSELGNLMDLQTLILSSNQLLGRIPTSFSGLLNLVDFRISDNNFTGPIPDFIQNWKQLQRLDMQASGLDGPIPASISFLNKLTQLRTSDLKGPSQGFPVLSNMTALDTLILRNCNISGEIPDYVWKTRLLRMLDVSFNELKGSIPDDLSLRTALRFVFLTGNKLSGKVPSSILQPGINVDLSYNNFTWQAPGEPACQPNMNLYINLFRSSSTTNSLMNILPCSRDITCPKHRCSVHVNSGGNDFTIKEGNREVLYEGDAAVDGGSARYFKTDNSYWGFSSTGDFLDDDNAQNTRYIANIPSSSLSEIYSTARLSPLSLTYFYYCLENGSYTVDLHFAEIQFANESTYSSLGKRIFDIYIQDKLVKKDFNIEDEARGVKKPLIKSFDAMVTNGNILEIRFYWAGKGTTRIPNRGVYGPLVSAISVNPKFKFCSSGKKKNITVPVTIGVVAVCIAVLILGVLWWKGCLPGKKRKEKAFDGLELQMVCFTLKQLKAATKNFDNVNKIGEGGFGPVYKGLLRDGTVIAVKQLSAKSRQGDREFLNEIGLISCVQHPNLVKLHGCCVESDQLMLVYEYLENNSLANSLFGSENSQLMLDWPTRFRISVGIAKGLAFLHEESRLKIVHRDIKATNVLLDRDLNPKISDFGLARLNEDDKTHISTRIAGTIGYMAPEYALWGYLTYKADVYSYGVMALEIVSGKNNNSYMPSSNFICLLDWACHLQQNNNFEELLDPRLNLQVKKDEVERLVKVAILCTNGTPSLRPTMSEVVSMLEGQTPIPDVIPQASPYSEDLRFKAMRDFHQEQQTQSVSSVTQNSSIIQTDIGSYSASNTDTFEINLDKTSK